MTRPRSLKDLKRQYEETGVNPFEGAHCFEFHLPNGTVIASACEKCGKPARQYVERRKGGDRRDGKETP